MDLARKSEALLREAARRPIREVRRLALDLKRLWRLCVKSDTARYNKIFIAGCARSGTTLTQRLMGCFEDTFVHRAEARYVQLDMLDRPEANLVVKRSERSHAHLARLPRAIGLIYCVRHPFDVLTSSHPESRVQRPQQLGPAAYRPAQPVVGEMARHRFRGRRPAPQAQPDGRRKGQGECAARSSHFRGRWADLAALCRRRRKRYRAGRTLPG